MTTNSFICKLEDSISCQNIYLLDYNEFTDFVKINKNGSKKAYKCNWKDCDLMVVLRKLDSNSNLQIVQELENLQKVSFHHNIIRFYGITKLSNDFYAILQYAKDGNLHQYLENNYSKLQWTDKLRIAEEITLGIKVLHKHNILHRNLNPENIFVHEEKMMIAYSTPDQSTDKMQLPYVAPEILRTEKHTCKADIYSLGIVLYEITTGLSPYHNILHDVNLEIKICNGIRPEFPSTMPKLVSQIISRCWDSEPSQRPKVEELNDELIQLHFTIEEN